MKRSLIVSQSPTVVPSEQLERIWKRLAEVEAWPQGRCLDAERRVWVSSISNMTQATLERVERIGVECGVISPSPDGWGTPVRESLWEHTPTQRKCAACQQEFTGKGRAEYCTLPECRRARAHARWMQRGDDWISSAEAGQRLGVHCQKVVEFARAGLLTRRMCGEHSRWDPAEVDALAAKRAEKARAA